MACFLLCMGAGFVILPPTTIYGGHSLCRYVSLPHGGEENGHNGKWTEAACSTHPDGLINVKAGKALKIKVRGHRSPKKSQKFFQTGTEST